MRIAVVNQYSSAGGGARFVRALVTALAKASPESEITLFADCTAVERDGIGDLFAGMANVSVTPMANGLAPKAEGRRPRLWRLRQIAKRIEPLAKFYYTYKAKQADSASAWFDFALDDQTLSALAAHDVVHFAWPYFIEPSEIDAPLVITMHDFNFKYPFGNFSERMLSLVEAQTPEWLRRSDRVVVSAEFMRQELRKFYPDNGTPVSIVRLTHFSITEHEAGSVDAIRKRFGLAGEYMLCASNTSKHKNIQTLLRAAGLLKQRGSRVPLVLAGFNTEHVGKYAGSNFPESHPLYVYERLTAIMAEYGLELDRDVLPLGYVSDAEIDALIRGAALVVAPSLYEAGSGPALDAWVAGTPVAFSDIPPFVEHLEFLKTEAYVFDPLDPTSIADQLERALHDKGRSRDMAERSREAIARYTWNNVALGYLEAYRAATERRRELHA